MFLASHICWVSSGTVRERYCWLPRDVRGAKPTMKKWRRGKGMRLTASLRRSEFSWPGKRRQQVMPAVGRERGGAGWEGGGNQDKTGNRGGSARWPKIGEAVPVGHVT